MHTVAHELYHAMNHQRIMAENVRKARSRIYDKAEFSFEMMKLELRAFQYEEELRRRLSKQAGRGPLDKMTDKEFSDTPLGMRYWRYWQEWFDKNVPPPESGQGGTTGQDPSSIAT
jgi:hypothetical protein